MSWRRALLCRQLVRVPPIFAPITTSSSPDEGLFSPSSSSIPKKKNVPVESSTSPPVSPPESTKPTNVGYLSGVLSSLWPWSAAAVEDSTKLPSELKQRLIVKKVSRSEIGSRTRSLAKKFLDAESPSSRLARCEQLCRQLVEHPGSRIIAVQDGKLIADLLTRLDSTQDDALRGAIRECLTLCGYVHPVKGRGIRVLSIDGGGTRGMMGLEVLEALELAAGARIAQLFDLIVGVSTGAIIAVLLGAKQLPVAEARRIYLEISRELFNQGKFSGVSGLLLSHSYYNTKKWIEILKRVLGHSPGILDSARDPGAPRIAIVSSVVNVPQLQAFIFRNYEHRPGFDSHYRGSCSHLVWQALQASAAAPGYFEEVVLGSALHQDGGVIANNPTAIALHEARLLWPNESLQCVVSVGNGRSVLELDKASVQEAPAASRLQEKIMKIVDSATDTEAVHIAMHDLLPAHVYYRLNPYMSHPYGLDEVLPTRLEGMQRDAKLYLRRNRSKVSAAAQTLLISSTPLQRLRRGFWLYIHKRGWYKP